MTREERFQYMYEYLFEYYSENLFFPSIRQIKRDLNLDNRSIYQTFEDLQNVGLVIKADNGARRLDAEDMMEAISLHKENTD